MRDHPSAAAALVLMLLMATGCAASPSVPDEEPTASQVVGVAWFDSDGNGLVGDNERPANDLQVSIGFETQRIGEPTTSDDRGGFLLDVPRVGVVGSDAFFVEAAIPVPGPGDQTIMMRYREAIVSDPRPPASIAIPQIESCEADLEEAVADEAACGRVVLPDLVPQTVDFGQPPTQPIAERSARIDLETTPGLVLLRFASATANVGTGPLHMIPDAEATGDSQQTWQRIWTDTDRFIDVRAGEFIFHSGHDHFHLDSFEQYRLLTLDGEVVATSDKISFCLIDSLPTVLGPPRRGLGVFAENACQSAGDQQVLNVGWADYYGAGLPDQWIDVTGVDPGEYLVEIIVDPDNILIEADETNNRATFPFTLSPSDLGE